MIIFPAIDIIDGKPVRLYKGDFSTAHQVADNVLETALQFEKAGAVWIHMVDLDGSLQKKPVNAKTFISVANETGLKVEIGGGIRTMQDIDFYVNNGISRIILGSVALKNPDLVKEAVKEFGDVIAVGIDAKTVMLQPKDGQRVLMFILQILQSKWKQLVLRPLFILIFQKTAH